MRFMNPKSRITLGLVGIMTSLIMLCFSFDIIPDRSAAVRQGRAALAESVAIYSSALVKTANSQGTNSQRLKDDFSLLVERNKDLLSLALHQENGRYFTATTGHGDLWQDMSGEYSHSSQIKVPIWSGPRQWGYLEMYFRPLTEPGILGWLKSPMVLTVLLVGLVGFIIYYFYLGKVLRQLDPSQAIPGRVRTALDTMAEGLLILDRKEQIVLANQAFSSMIDRTPDSLLGFRAGELPWSDHAGKQIAKANRPWITALATGEVQKDHLLRLQLTEFEYRTFKINCSPVLGEGGKHAGVLVSFDDVTELEEKEAELISSKLEAEEANRAKSSFLANMSHEIRTPMTAILGFADLLKRGYVKNEQESLKYLNTIHSSGKNLLELINDILDLSKVESGHLEIEKLTIKPYQIIDEVVQVLKGRADEKAIGLEYKGEGLLPETIEADPVRLRQIFLNLIGNSIKFTESGKVVVSCRFVEDSSKSQLLIDIKDSGIGMTPEAQRSIFDPFVQADNTVSRRFGGTGLGLAISLKFAQAMGGNISVKSRLGQGSVFTVALPIGDLKGVEFLKPEEVFRPQERIEQFENARVQLPAAQVLVVDDGVENRALIRILLEEAGLSVDEAENGQQGVELSAVTAYDLILMDVNMPVMDGFTAVGIMRDQGLVVPIIALTANAMKGYEAECLAAGYSGYQSKPIDIDQFMALMTQLLSGIETKGSSSVPPPANADTQRTALSQPTNGEKIISSLPANNEKFHKIICRFIERLGVQLNALDAAADKQDFEEVLSLAHWLKGAGGTVGFDIFTEPATELETQVKNLNLSAVKDIIATLRSLAGRIGFDDQMMKEETTPESVASLVSSQIIALAPLQPLISRLAGNTRLTKIILRFIDSLEEKIKLMQSALAFGNMEELESLAHWLRGAGGTVGYDEFTAPATELELFARSGQVAKAQKSVDQIVSMAQVIVSPEEVTGEISEGIVSH